MRRTIVWHLRTGALLGVPVLALAMLIAQGPAAARAQEDPSKESQGSGSAEETSQDTKAEAAAETNAEQPSTEAKTEVKTEAKAGADASVKESSEASQTDQSKGTEAADASKDAAAADASKTDKADTSADQSKGDRSGEGAQRGDRNRDRDDADRRSQDDRGRTDGDRADRNRDRDDRDQARDRDRDASDRADRRDRDSDRRFSADRDNDRRGGRRDRDRTARFGVFFAVGGGDRLTVTRISQDTVAARVGLVSNDTIVSVNGHHVRTQSDFDRYIFAEPNDRVTIIVLRDGRERTLYVDADDLSGLTAVRDESVMVAHKVDLGLVIDDSVADAAIVLEVHRNSPADEVGVRKGDRIAEINGQSISSPDSYHQAVADLRPGEDVELKFGQSDTETVHLRLDAGEDAAVNVDDDDVDVRVRRDRDPVRVEGKVEIEGGPAIEGSGTIRTEQPRRRGIMPRRGGIFNRQ